MYVLFMYVYVCMCADDSTRWVPYSHSDHLSAFLLRGPRANLTRRTIYTVTSVFLTSTGKNAKSTLERTLAQKADSPRNT